MSKILKNKNFKNWVELAQKVSFEMVHFLTKNWGHKESPGRKETVDPIWIYLNKKSDNSFITYITKTNKKLKIRFPVSKIGSNATELQY